MSAIIETEDRVPIFNAVSTSVRQLCQLLNCIRFAPKVQIHISPEGIQFAVEEGRVMQGMHSTGVFSVCLYLRIQRPHFLIKLSLHPLHIIPPRPATTIRLIPHHSKYL